MSFDVQLNAFVSLPFSKMTESMLEREGIHYYLENSKIIAYGNRVDEFANILGGDTRRPMQTGLLNPAEPKNLLLIKLVLDELCGSAGKGEKICFSVPSAPPGQEDDIIYHEKSVRMLLENLGYQVKTVNEGLAIVYAELLKSDFTGIGISFGAGLCNVCFTYLGLPVVTFCTPLAGDYIDRCASSVTGETPTKIRLCKENGFNMSRPASDNVEHALAIYYHDVIQRVVADIERAFAESSKLPEFNRPVPVAIAGGTAQVGGFLSSLKEKIKRVDLPFEISEVRLSKDPLNATAKGTAAAANM